jgi:hypothetical protein
VEGVCVRREIEAIRDVRSLIARRSDDVDRIGLFDMVRESEAGLMMASRLLSVGVLDPEDFDLADFFVVDGQSVEQAARLSEAKIRSSVWRRLKSIKPALAEADLERIDPLLGDVVCLVVEVASYRRGYWAICKGVLDCKPKYLKLRQFPSSDRADRAERLSYRSEDPGEVIEKYSAIIATAKSRVSWAKARLRREKYLSGRSSAKPNAKSARGSKKAEPVVEVFSVSGLLRAFHNPAIEKRLAKLRRPPDLLREAGIEDQSSPATD